MDAIVSWQAVLSELNIPTKQHVQPSFAAGPVHTPATAGQHATAHITSDVFYTPAVETPESTPIDAWHSIISSLTGNGKAACSRHAAASGSGNAVLSPPAAAAAGSNGGSSGSPSMVRRLFASAPRHKQAGTQHRSSPRSRGAEQLGPVKRASPRATAVTGSPPHLPVRTASAPASRHDGANQLAARLDGLRASAELMLKPPLHDREPPVPAAASWRTTTPAAASTGSPAQRRRAAISYSSSSPDRRICSPAAANQPSSSASSPSGSAAAAAGFGSIQAHGSIGSSSQRHREVPVPRKLFQSPGQSSPGSCHRGVLPHRPCSPGMGVMPDSPGPTAAAPAAVSRGLGRTSTGSRSSAGWVDNGCNATSTPARAGSSTFKAQVQQEYGHVQQPQPSQPLQLQLRGALDKVEQLLAAVDKSQLRPGQRYSRDAADQANTAVQAAGGKQWVGQQQDLRQQEQKQQQAAMASNATGGEHMPMLLQQQQLLLQKLLEQQQQLLQQLQPSMAGGSRERPQPTPGSTADAVNADDDPTLTDPASANRSANKPLGVPAASSGTTAGVRPPAAASSASSGSAGAGTAAVATVAAAAAACDAAASSAAAPVTEAAERSLATAAGTTAGASIRSSSSTGNTPSCISSKTDPSSKADPSSSNSSSSSKDSMSSRGMRQQWMRSDAPSSKTPEGMAANSHGCRPAAANATVHHSSSSAEKLGDAAAAASDSAVPCPAAAASGSQLRALHSSKSPPDRCTAVAATTDLGTAGSGPKSSNSWSSSDRALGLPQVVRFSGGSGTATGSTSGEDRKRGSSAGSNRGTHSNIPAHSAAAALQVQHGTAQEALEAAQQRPQQQQQEQQQQEEQQQQQQPQQQEQQQQEQQEEEEEGQAPETPAPALPRVHTPGKPAAEVAADMTTPILAGSAAAVMALTEAWRQEAGEEQASWQQLLAEWSAAGLDTWQLPAQSENESFLRSSAAPSDSGSSQQAFASNHNQQQQHHMQQQQQQQQQVVEAAAGSADGGAGGKTDGHAAGQMVQPPQALAEKDLLLGRLTAGESEASELSLACLIIKTATEQQQQQQHHHHQQHPAQPGMWQGADSAVPPSLPASPGTTRKQLFAVASDGAGMTSSGSIGSSDSSSGSLQGDQQTLQQLQQQQPSGHEGQLQRTLQKQVEAPSAGNVSQQQQPGLQRLSQLMKDLRHLQDRLHAVQMQPQHVFTEQAAAPIVAHDSAVPDASSITDDMTASISGRNGVHAAATAAGWDGLDGVQAAARDVHQQQAGQASDVAAVHSQGTPAEPQHSCDAAAGTPSSRCGQWLTPEPVAAAAARSADAARGIALLKQKLQESRATLQAIAGTTPLTAAQPRVSSLLDEAPAGMASSQQCASSPLAAVAGGGQGVSSRGGGDTAARTAAACDSSTAADIAASGRKDVSSLRLPASDWLQASPLQHYLKRSSSGINRAAASTTSATAAAAAGGAANTDASSSWLSQGGGTQAGASSQVVHALVSKWRAAAAAKAAVNPGAETSGAAAAYGAIKAPQPPQQHQQQQLSPISGLLTPLLSETHQGAMAHVASAANMPDTPSLLSTPVAVAAGQPAAAAHKLEASPFSGLLFPMSPLLSTTTSTLGLAAASSAATPASVCSRGNSRAAAVAAGQPQQPLATPVVASEPAKQPLGLPAAAAAAFSSIQGGHKGISSRTYSSTRVAFPASSNSRSSTSTPPAAQMPAAVSGVVAPGLAAAFRFNFGTQSTACGGSIANSSSSGASLNISTTTALQQKRSISPSPTAAFKLLGAGASPTRRLKLQQQQSVAAVKYQQQHQPTQHPAGSSAATASVSSSAASALVDRALARLPETRLPVPAASSSTGSVASRLLRPTAAAQQGQKPAGAATAAAADQAYDTLTLLADQGNQPIAVGTGAAGTWVSAKWQPAATPEVKVAGASAATAAAANTAGSRSGGAYARGLLMTRDQSPAAVLAATAAVAEAAKVSLSVGAASMGRTARSSSALQRLAESAQLYPSPTGLKACSLYAGVASAAGARWAVLHQPTHPSSTAPQQHKQLNGRQMQAGQVPVSKAAGASAGCWLPG